MIISDLIRFICCSHHPPNEILQSNVISRWAIIGWLLKSCTRNHAEANAKLALFYDWLFFDEKVDNIMNIEPAILLMVNSFPRYLEMTNGLLEFLFLLVDNYDLNRRDMIASGVTASFEVLVKKRVIDSLEVLTSCSYLSPALKNKLLILFANCKSATPCKLPELPNTSIVDSKEPFDSCTYGVSMRDANGCARHLVHPALQVSGIQKLVDEFQRNIEQSMEKGLSSLEHILRSFAGMSGQILDEEKDINVSDPKSLAIRVSELFKSRGYQMFSDRFVPSDETKSATNLVIRSCIYSQNERMQKMVLFWSRQGQPVGACFLSYASRLAYELHNMDVLRSTPGRQRSSPSKVLKLLDIGSEDSLLRFHVDPCYCCISYKQNERNNVQSREATTATVDECELEQLVEGAFLVYRNFIEVSKKSSFDTRMTNGCLKDHIADMLLHDLKLCCGWDRKQSKYHFENVLCYLSDLSTSRESFIYLLVDLLDHGEVLTMQFDIGLHRYSIFNGNEGSLLHLVECSLRWDSVKQQKFWNLLVSQVLVSNLQLDELVMHLCGHFVDVTENCVPFGALLTLLRSLPPTVELLCLVLCMPNNFLDFAASILANWFAWNFSILFESLTKLIEKLNCEANCVAINSSTILRFINFIEMQELGNGKTSVLQMKDKLFELVNRQNSS